MTCVLFACVHNAGRSQMAAAFFNCLVDPTFAYAISAGTEPAPHVNPSVVAAMLEVGIDLREAKPKRLTTDLAAQANILITMGCGESCPIVPGVSRNDWELPDPHGQPIEQVRLIRDAIRKRLAEFIHANGWKLKSN